MASMVSHTLVSSLKGAKNGESLSDDTRLWWSPTSQEGH